MKGSATYWSILIVVAILVAAMLAGLWPGEQNFEQATGLIDSSLWQELKVRTGQVSERISEEVKKAEELVLTAFEKQQIEAWIARQGLNRYGDPADTVYAGGTPLFNEMTGETRDRYDYIVARHPDRPWRE